MCALGGGYSYIFIKKKWRYPGKPIPDRLKDKYSNDPKPELRVKYD